MTVSKKENFFSHIALVYNLKKKLLKNKFLLKKKRLNFYKIKNPKEKIFLYSKYSNYHNISLFFKNKNYFLETIGYKYTNNLKNSLYKYHEKKDHIQIFSSSPDFKSDIKIFSLFMNIKKKSEYYSFKTKNGTQIRLYENFKKLKKKIYLENEGINVLSFFIKDIKKTYLFLKKNNISVSKIFYVKLIKKNKIFFSRFPSGIIVEFLNY